MILFDSSIWVALANENDPQHEKSIGLLDILEQNQISIPDFIFTETLTVLKIKSSLETCSKYLKILKVLNIDIILTETNQYELAYKIFFNEEKKLSFTDCLLMATAYLENGNLITFDKSLEKAWNLIKK